MLVLLYNNLALFILPLLNYLNLIIHIQQSRSLNNLAFLNINKHYLLYVLLVESKGKCLCHDICIILYLESKFRPCDHITRCWTFDSLI